MSFADLLTCFLQAAMTPFVGSAGNALNRVILSAVGTVIWGVTSVGLGAAQSFAQVGELPPIDPKSAAYILSASASQTCKGWSQRVSVGDNPRRK